MIASMKWYLFENVDQTEGILQGVDNIPIDTGGQPMRLRETFEADSLEDAVRERNVRFGWDQ